MKRALFHTKAAASCLRKAASALDVDIDAAPFDNELPDNPEGKRAAHLRLVREFAARRYW
jgi:hypothetical protein